MLGSFTQNLLLVLLIIYLTTFLVTYIVTSRIRAIKPLALEMEI